MYLIEFYLFVVVVFFREKKFILLCGIFSWILLLNDRLLV